MDLHPLNVRVKNNNKKKLLTIASRGFLEGRIPLQLSLRKRMAFSHGGMMLDGDNYSRAEMPIPWYSARIKLCLTESLAGRYRISEAMSEVS